MHHLVWALIGIATSQSLHTKELDVLLAPPKSEEIQAVRDMWAKRDLSPKNVRLEHSFTTDHDMEARIYSHLVHGSRHYGCVVVPKGASPKSCPVILDMKGVSPSYFELRVPTHIGSMDILGEDAKKFVFVSPCLRGETLIADGKSFHSEGNPDDSWDGATDDSLALLNVALQEIPAADANRISATGRSRGGSLALLVAERDQRIKRTYAWAGPAGWIENMEQGGKSQREQITYGLQHGSSLTTYGGQWIRSFLKPVLDGKEKLEHARLRLIASSPIYFVSSLPITEAHFGMLDPVVMPKNGRDLEKALKGLEAEKRVKITYHEGIGHGIGPSVYPSMRKFFLDLR